MPQSNTTIALNAKYELALLWALSTQCNPVDCAMAEIARLSAVPTLPKGTSHVISDFHGEDKKLRHVINNASGTLRPIIEKMFASEWKSVELSSLHTLLVREPTHPAHRCMLDVES